MPILSARSVLGQNARALVFAGPLNPKKAQHFSKDKLRSKLFLAARGIPVARLLASLETSEAVRLFDFDTLPAKIAVKPNLGAGGNGILILTRDRGGQWFSPGGEFFAEERIKNHMLDILDGQFATDRFSDKVLIEEQIQASEALAPILPAGGLPDIRVIVFNLTPVMAMVRIPTEKSGGKANMDQGGVAAGIDLATGRLTNFVAEGATGYRSVRKIPGTETRAGDFKLPFWDEILELSAKIQLLTNIGFLGVDFTLGERLGPVVLEVNSRPGMKIQVANRDGLRGRIERVSGVRVAAPEQGVLLAKTLFSEKKSPFSPVKKDPLRDRPVIGPDEEVEILATKDAKTSRRVRAKSFPGEPENWLDAGLAAELGLAGKILVPGMVVPLRLKFGGKTHRLRATIRDLSDRPYPLALGADFLKNFLIDPARRPAPVVPPTARADLIHHTQDAALSELDREAKKILFYLRPLNLSEEKARFFAKPKTAPEPHFLYPSPSFDEKNFRRRLAEFAFDESPLGELFEKKRREIGLKLDLIAARGDAAKFTAAGSALYAPPDPALVADAERIIEESFSGEEKTENREKKVSAEVVRRAFSAVLKKYRLDWRVYVREDVVARCVIGDRTILLGAGQKFSETSVERLIAHEIGAHVLTRANGLRQPWRILADGTANYLETQEGLATFLEETVAKPDPVRRRLLALRVVLTDRALRGAGFRTLFAEARAAGFSKETAWGLTLGVKRGLGDTGAGGGFSKGVIYFRGVRKIRDFLDGGGDFRDLYLGRVAVEDLPLVKKIPDLQEPAFFPEIPS